MSRSAMLVLVLALTACAKESPTKKIDRRIPTTDATEQAAKQDSSWEGLPYKQLACKVLNNEQSITIPPIGVLDKKGEGFQPEYSGTFKLNDKDSLEIHLSFEKEFDAVARPIKKPTQFSIKYRLVYYPNPEGVVRVSEESSALFREGTKIVSKSTNYELSCEVVGSP